MLKYYKVNQIGILLVLLYSVIHSEISFPIEYHGVLTDSTGNPLPDGEYPISFQIFTDSSGGGVLCSKIKKFPIYKGLIDIKLRRESFSGLPRDQKQYWLSVSVEGKTLNPRIRLSSTTQVIRADTACVSNANTTYTVTNTKLIEIIQEQQKRIDELINYYIELEANKVIDIE